MKLNEGLAERLLRPLQGPFQLQVFYSQGLIKNQLYEQNKFSFVIIIKSFYLKQRSLEATISWRIKYAFVALKKGSDNSSIQSLIFQGRPMQQNQARPNKVIRQHKYNVISLEKRLRLIELVTQKNMSIYKASRMAGVNNATAKDIIRKYRKTGNIFVRKQEIKDYQEEENFSEDHYKLQNQEEKIVKEQYPDSPEINKEEDQPSSELVKLQNFPSYPTYPMMFYYPY